MKMYEMILKTDETSVIIETVACESEEQAIEIYGGNGEIVRILDVTKSYPIDIDKLDNVLKSTNYGMPERRLIMELLTRHHVDNDMMTSFNF